MKKFTEILEKAALGTSENPLTNQDNYEDVKSITDACGEIHYIDNYKDSNKIKEILAKKTLIEPLDSEQNKNYDGGVLYSNGHLVYFFWFHKMEYLCRFIVYFHKYLEVFDYDKNNDGKWHMYFDIHGDPLTGVDNKSTCWHLEFRAKEGKREKLETIDKAIDDLYKEIEKFEVYGELKENNFEFNETYFKNLYQQLIEQK